MNPRVTVALLVVLLALGGYLYFGPNQAPSGGGAASGAPGARGAASKPPPTADPALDMFTFDDRAVDRLTVTGSSGQGVEVARSAEGTWTLQPSGEPADRVRLSGVVLRLSNLRATRRIAEPANLADFGLSPPAVTATVTTGGDEERLLILGTKAPAEAGTYAMKGGDSAVYLVTNALAQDLERLVTEPPR